MIEVKTHTSQCTQKEFEYSWLDWADENNRPSKELFKDQETIDKLESLGYKAPKPIEGKGWCAVVNTFFVFTNAIIYGIDKTGMTWAGRYCYPKSNPLAPLLAFAQWDGQGDPTGPWVKHKGAEEYSNPNQA